MPQQPNREKNFVNRERLLSQRGAAELLGKDRETMARALRNVPPDGYAQNGAGRQARWTLATVLAAMEAHERRNGRPARSPAVAPELARLEQAQRNVTSFLQRLAAEPSIERRRELAQEQGVCIGRLDRALADTQSNDAAAVALGPFRDAIVRQAVQELTWLCQWDLAA